MDDSLLKGSEVLKLDAPRKYPGKPSAPAVRAAKAADVAGAAQGAKIREVVEARNSDASLTWILSSSVGPERSSIDASNKGGRGSLSSTSELGRWKLSRMEEDLLRSSRLSAGTSIGWNLSEKMPGRSSSNKESFCETIKRLLNLEVAQTWMATIAILATLVSVALVLLIILNAKNQKSRALPSAKPS